ncbi:MAG: phosphate acyltransferase PlsX [bacterium]
MIIAVDAMGGDKGPKVVVEGAVHAAQAYGIQVLLVGYEDIVKEELSKYNLKGLSIYVKHAPEVVAMHELPSLALRQKKKSSITVATSLQRSGEADAVISAGNTGAAMAVAKVYLGTLKGVERPAIATLLPTRKGFTIMLDVGANVDCNPSQFLQFAIMGSIYSKYIFKVESPSIGLLNIGEEEGKGSDLIKEAFRTLKEAPINFIGNVEGGDVYRGKVDVVVCDGFVGNIVLKISESVAEMVEVLLKEEFEKRFFSKVGYLLARPSFKAFKRKVDYSEYGGAPLLGINGVVIISHGRSDAKAIKNAIKVASEFVKNNVNKHICESINALNPLTVDHSNIPVGSRKGSAGIWQQLKESIVRK